MRRIVLVAAAALALAPAAGGLRAEEQPTAPLVFVPSSLTDVVGAAADLFAKEGLGPRPALSVGSTADLARQVLKGAPCDLFLSADAEWMDELEKQGAIEPGTRVALAGNRLACVTHPSVDPPPLGPRDLAEGRFGKIAVAGESVPAGRYARAALAHARTLDAVKPHLVNAPSVRAALALAEKGEVDAAIVYASDAAASKLVRLAFLFARESHPPIVYPAAVVKGAKSAEAARRFLAFLRSEKAQAIFERAGFPPPPPPAPAPPPAK